MSYSLWRGTGRLGRIEVLANDIAVMGFLVVETTNSDLRSEIQAHFPADGDTPALVATMPCEVQLISRPLTQGPARGSLRGQKFERTNVVAPEDELRVFEDDRMVRARSVRLSESRYIDDWAKDIARALPPGVLYGDSEWAVTAWLEPVPSRPSAPDDETVSVAPSVA